MFDGGCPGLDHGVVTVPVSLSVLMFGWRRGSSPTRSLSVPAGHYQGRGSGLVDMQQLDEVHMALLTGEVQQAPATPTSQVHVILWLDEQLLNNQPRPAVS